MSFSLMWAMECSLLEYQAKIHIVHIYTGLTSFEDVKPALYGKSNLKRQMQTLYFNCSHNM